MKLKYISAVATLAILMPFAASALTADDLQQQIQSLLSQISQLQQQLAQLTTTNPSQVACTMEAKICPDGTAVGRTGPNCEFAACPHQTGGVEPAPGNACPVFTRTIAQGATGDDVKSLQAALGVSQTGFFGPVTAQAVSTFQAEAGLEQVGIVGPQTRDALWRRCGGGGWNRNFSASPTSGQAPLSVNFSYPYSSDNGTYTVEFGDGASGQMTKFLTAGVCSQGYCAQTGSWVANHTYTSNGVYSAKLIYEASFSCPPGAMCPAMMPMPRTIGTVTIYVGSSSGTGAPVINGIDGPASLSVGQTGTWTVRASVPNTADTNLRYSVVWGDEGVIGQLNAFAGNVPSAIWTSGSFTHAYQNAGTYKPVFTVSNSAGSAQTSASVVVGGSSSESALYASPTSGQAPLPVHFWAGVSGSGLTIDFGDGTSGNFSGGWCPPNPAMGAPCSAPGADHTYTFAGTYTAKLLKYPEFTTNCYNCAQPAPQVLGTVTITVYGTPTPPPAGTFSASPTSGGAPLYVTFLSNTTGSVNFGDGTSGQMSPNCRMGFEPWLGGGNSSCDTGEYFVGHTYTSAGTYTAKLLKYPEFTTNCYNCAQPAPQVLGTVTITVVAGSRTDDCLSVYGCSGTMPPSQYPNMTSSAQVHQLGRSCVLVGNSYTCNYQTTGGSCSASAGNAWVCAYQPSYSCGVGPVTVTSSWPCSYQDSLAL